MAGGRNAIKEARAMAGGLAPLGNAYAPIKYNSSARSPPAYNSRPNPPRLQTVSAALPELKPLQTSQPLAGRSPLAGRAPVDAELACRKAVGKELAKLQFYIGPDGPGRIEDPGDTVQFLRLVAERLRRMRQTHVPAASAAPPGRPAEEQAELDEKLKRLALENAKCKRYIQRQRANIEKLQTERKRYAEEKAQSDFKLVEALAGRDPDALQKAGSEPAAGGGEAEAKLRERHADAAETTAGTTGAVGGKEMAELASELQASKEQRSKERNSSMQQQQEQLQRICELTAELDQLKNSKAETADTS